MKLAVMFSYDDEFKCAYGEKRNAGKERGQPLIDRLFTKLNQAGFRAVLWRVMMGGWAMFRSKEYKISFPLDIDEFDPTAAAKSKAEELGMEFHIWHEIRGSEAHGFAGDCHSTYIHEHPEFLSINRRKMISAAELSWAAPDVMRRRVATFREILAYQPMGIWIDHLKGGDVSVPSYDRDGYYECGYDTFMIEAFTQKTRRDPWQIPNSDPEWLAFRASYVSEYMRRIRKVQQEKAPNTFVGSLGASIGNDTIFCEPMPKPPDHYEHTSLPSPLANLEDHETWTREGLIDILSVPHNTVPTPQRIQEVMVDAKSRLRGDCRFSVGLWPRPQTIEECARVAYQGQAEYLIIREAFALHAQPELYGIFPDLAAKFGDSD